MIINKVLNFLKTPAIRFNYFSRKGLYDRMSDEEHIRREYYYMFGKYPDLKNPKTFNEKSQWLKLNDRKDIYAKMVDKYEAKKFVANIIGDKYIIPTIGIYNKFDEIDFDKLPKQFVIKCTHDSGGLVICEDKDNFDKKAAKKKISKRLKCRYYYHHREWPYKNVKPRIIIEPLMKNQDGTELVEYNFFCFNGVPKLVMTCHGDKRIKRYNNFYDIDFNKLYFGCGYDFTNDVETPPKKYNEMIEISKKLSRGMPFLRVDFYLLDNEIKIGELTFYHWAGFGKFNPEEWDRKLGDLMDLTLVGKS